MSTREASVPADTGEPASVCGVSLPPHGGGGGLTLKLTCQVVVTPRGKVNGMGTRMGHLGVWFPVGVRTRAGFERARGPLPWGGLHSILQVSELLDWEFMSQCFCL